MSASLYHAIDPGKFATFLIASVSPNHDRLGYCNAGHNPGLLVHAGRIQRLEVTSSPLGVLDRIECAEKEVRFARGDLLVLYSDGITEARGNGTIFGEERLEGLVCMLGRSAVPAEEVGRAILAEVSRFCGGDRYDDDVTLVVARRR